MKKTIALLATLIGGTAMAQNDTTTASTDTAKSSNVAIVIHGGAGTIKRENLSAQQEKDIKAVLQQALDAGHQALSEGKEATAGVIAAITILEDSPFFNAGHGAVFTKPGKHELDASIMRGSDLNAGAVAGVSFTKNPILAAEQVMLNSPHVMLAGTGADTFSKLRALEQVENTYFDTDSKPQQANETINYLKIKANKAITVGKFTLDNTIMYQKVAKGDSLFRVPELVTRNTLYYADNWFKGNPLFVNIGVTFKYFTAYYANGYNPVLAEFNLQNDVKIGNYPTVDVFFNAQVRRTRLYLKVDNATSSFLERNYFSAPNYPYRDFTVRFGLVWNWFI